jgi:hypothetical protein
MLLVIRQLSHIDTNGAHDSEGLMNVEELDGNRYDRQKKIDRVLGEACDDNC